MKLIDLSGSVFGRLTVIRRTANKGRHTRWDFALTGCFAHCCRGLLTIQRITMVTRTAAKRRKIFSGRSCVFSGWEDQSTVILFLEDKRSSKQIIDIPRMIRVLISRDTPRSNNNHKDVVRIQNPAK